MVCHKCGFEHNSDKECPKCGATVIKINEDYLKRKKAYEESGKITFAGVDVDTLDKLADTKVDINIEETKEKELSPKEAMAIAYDKMKSKGQSVIRNTKNKRSADKNKKSNNGRQKKEPTDYKKIIKVAAIIVAAIFLITMAVVVVRNVFFKENAKVLWTKDGKIYETGNDKPLFENVSKVIANKKENKMIIIADKTYMYTEKETKVISEKPVNDIYYNDDMTLLIYNFADSNQVYIYSEKTKETKLDINSKITDSYITADGLYAALVTYNHSTLEYTLWRLDGVGHVWNVETDINEKDVKFVNAEGYIVYSDYTYTDINSIVTSKIKINRDKISGIEIENVNEYIVYENYIIYRNDEAQLELMDYTISAKNTIVLENVEEIYTSVNNTCKYTNYGDTVCQKGENDKLLVMCGSKIYLYDLKEQTTQYLSDCSIASVEFYYFEDSRYFYMKTVSGINQVDLKTGENKFLATLLPSEKVLCFDKSKSIVYNDYYGKLVEIKNGKSTVIAEGVKTGSVKMTEDGTAYTYVKDVTVYAKQLGKEKVITLYTGIESISDIKNVVYADKLYYFIDTNGKLTTSDAKGKEKKVIGECSQIYMIYKKGI